MEIIVPIQGIESTKLLLQLRFFADRHLVIITDTASKNHGAMFQVETTLDEGQSAELLPEPGQHQVEQQQQLKQTQQKRDDDFDAELDRQMMSNQEEAEQEEQEQKLQQQRKNQQSGAALNVEITPLLGASRDNQWALLLIRRVATAVAGTLLLGQQQQQHDHASASSPALSMANAATDPASAFVPSARFTAVLRRAFAMSMLVMVHVPAVLDKPENSAAVLGAIRAAEAELRRRLVE